ncbi:MAG: hypothetical protein R3C59_27440 [Planctomycetaceae bacterium]
MSIEKFEAVLAAGRYSQAEQTWFPTWYLRFREFLREHELLPVDVDRSIVILFLQQVKAQGTPAWQRLQAVQSIEAYHREVLQRPIADLHEVITTLRRIASQQNNWMRIVHYRPMSRLAWSG